MKSFFLLLLSLLLFLSLSGCSPKYDYAVHPPKIKYQTPSRFALSQTLQEKLGSDYVWAEEGPGCFDCSGLVYYSYGRMNMAVPRVSREQAKVGKTISVDELQYGDLLFFDTGKVMRGTINHVGIYIGHGKFQHASNSKEGVIVTDVANNYYSKRLIVCKRYLTDEQVIPPDITTDIVPQESNATEAPMPEDITSENSQANAPV